MVGAVGAHPDFNPRSGRTGTTKETPPDVRKSCLELRWRNIFAALAGALLLGALAACDDHPGESKASVGKPFPDMSLAAPGDTRPVSFATYRGRNVILNVWATWCEPCRKEMPSLERVAANTAPDKLAVVGVAIDTDYNLVREFLLRYGIHFQNLSDPGGRITGEALDVKFLPETFLISRNGSIAARFLGPRDWSSPETRIDIEKALGPGTLAP